MSTSSRTFNPGDLIWAKMKGFPPWPAKVLPMDGAVETPVGRVPVLFFGTKETAYMKSSDIFDYDENKHTYEVPRKHKGFNEAVHEIRVAAGTESASAPDPLFAPAAQQSTSSDPSQADMAMGLLDAGPMSMGGISGIGGMGGMEPETSGRMRRPSSKLVEDAFIGGFERKRANSNASSVKSRSRASSTASMLKQLKRVKREQRKRLDSESSNGSRRQKMISGMSDRFSAFDVFEQLEQLNPLGDLGIPGLPMDAADSLAALAEDVRSQRSKRSRGSSRVFEEYMTGVAGRRRHKSGSDRGSEGKRSRLISGVSDVFDELFEHAQTVFSAEALMLALDELPSETSSQGRPGTPEAPAPLPAPGTFCSECGCECQPYGSKWRCTSKFCLKWYNPFDGPSTSQQQQPGPSHSQAHHPHAFVKPEFDPPLEQQQPSTSSMAALPPPPQKELKPALMMNRGVKLEPLEIKTDGSVCSSQGSVVKERKRVQITSPLPMGREKREREKEREREARGRDKDGARPKQYKVEKTPPVDGNGLRHCAFCNGQVRPQMCGGNKHRWRCVDKKCRKWYGWVRSNEEIPRDLGKKGRWKDLNVKLKRKGHSSAMSTASSETAHAIADIEEVSSPRRALMGLVGMDDEEEEDDGRAGMQREEPSPVPESPPKKRLGRPPKSAGLKIKLKSGTTKKPKDDPDRPKRKYVKRKDREAAAAAGIVLPGSAPKEKRPKQDAVKPPLSPLSAQETAFRPCAMQKRARWWTSEKRRVDASPPRSLGSSVADTAAAFRMLAHACRAAAVTRADEPGTVSGTLDLLMDSLVGSIAPLLSLSQKIPGLNPEPELVERLWNASAVHMPMFS